LASTLEEMIQEVTRLDESKDYQGAEVVYRNIIENFPDIKARGQHALGVMLFNFDPKKKIEGVYLNFESSRSFPECGIAYAQLLGAANFPKSANFWYEFATQRLDIQADELLEKTAESNSWNDLVNDEIQINNAALDGDRYALFLSLWYGSLENAKRYEYSLQEFIDSFKLTNDSSNSQISIDKILITFSVFRLMSNPSSQDCKVYLQNLSTAGNSLANFWLNLNTKVNGQEFHEPFSLNLSPDQQIELRTSLQEMIGIGDEVARAWGEMGLEILDLVDNTESNQEELIHFDPQAHKKLVVNGAESNVCVRHLTELNAGGAAICASESGLQNWFNFDFGFDCWVQIMTMHESIRSDEVIGLIVNPYGPWTTSAEGRGYVEFVSGLNPGDVVPSGFALNGISTARKVSWGFIEGPDLQQTWPSLTVKNCLGITTFNVYEPEDFEDDFDLEIPINGELVAFNLLPEEKDEIANQAQEEIDQLLISWNQYPFVILRKEHLALFNLVDRLNFEFN
jgi:hypothetical protein